MKDNDRKIKIRLDKKQGKEINEIVLIASLQVRTIHFLNQQKLIKYLFNLKNLLTEVKYLRVNILLLPILYFSLV